MKTKFPLSVFLGSYLHPLRCLNMNTSHVIIEDPAVASHREGSLDFSCEVGQGEDGGAL